MGNTLGRGKKAKVMKIDGETFKLKTPVTARDVVKDYPGHVLLESESVKKFGIRAKPLESHEELKPKKIYFLIELPKLPEKKEEIRQQPRRVRSGIQMSAKDRLECLMLSRRAVSDLSIVRQSQSFTSGPLSDGADSGLIRVKMRLPKSQVDKLMKESEDNVQVAEKIVDLFMENSAGDSLRRSVHWKPELGSIGENFIKPRQKPRVSFAQDEGEIQLLASQY
ncbi:plastid movement impaired 2 [Euphorbia peplus]|nr:plastid movement impaired 2 [Euphorbia peplus]